jgi:hypothetical protein
MATSLSLSIIASPHSFSLHSLPSLLKSYFRTPRVLCEGDVIALRIPFLVGKSTSLSAFDDVEDDMILKSSEWSAAESDGILKLLSDNKHEKWIYFEATKLEHSCEEDACHSEETTDVTYVVDHRVTQIVHSGMKRHEVS